MVFMWMKDCEACSDCYAQNIGLLTACLFCSTKATLFTFSISMLVVCGKLRCARTLLKPLHAARKTWKQQDNLFACSISLIDVKLQISSPPSLPAGSVDHAHAVVASPTCS